MREPDNTERTTFSCTLWDGSIGQVRITHYSYHSFRFIVTELKWLEWGVPGPYDRGSEHKSIVTPAEIAKMLKSNGGRVF